MAIALSKEWHTAISEVESRPEMPHYKPAALLVMLDMLNAGEASEGHIPFLIFERRFESLLRDFDPKGSRRGWESFYHLSTGDRIWDLFKEGKPSVFPPNKGNESRSYILRHADRAVIKSHLLSFVLTKEGQDAARNAILEILKRDVNPKSQHLLATVRGTLPTQLDLSHRCYADSLPHSL
jgi:hypothetical protein